MEGAKGESEQKANCPHGQRLKISNLGTNICKSSIFVSFQLMLGVYVHKSIYIDMYKVWEKAW